MAVHTVMLPDRRYGDEPRSLVWDDEAGTVEGTHAKVPGTQRTLAEPRPVNRSCEGRVLYLDDPGAGSDRLPAAVVRRLLADPSRAAALHPAARLRRRRTQPRPSATTT